MTGIWRASSAGIRLSNQLSKCVCRCLGSSSVQLSKFVMKGIEEKSGKKMLNVTWQDDTSNAYPYIYLRDNCQCSQCYFKDSNQRLVDVVRDVDLNVRPTNVEMSEDGSKLSIAWPDKHETTLDADFLFRKRLPTEAELKDTVCEDVTTRKVNLWGSEFKDHIPHMKYHDILQDEMVEFEFLNSLYRYGLALVTDMPIQDGLVEKLGEHIGYLRMTAYGKTIVVSTRLQANSVAYTSYTLPLHSDLPYYEAKPGIQMLFCKEQTPTEGGENSLVDSFHVAQQLKKEDPGAYELLTTTHILFRTSGTDILGEYDLEGARPLLELDHHGRLLRCNHNEGCRLDFLGVPAEKIHEMYKAYYSLTKRLKDPKNMFLHKLSPGEMIVFDNDRVLHGREGYTLSEEGGRCLESAYIDWDVARSRLSVLGKRLGKGPVARMDSKLSVTGQWSVS